MQITMPDVTKQVDDLRIALMLLDHSVVGSGIDFGSTHLWVNFETGDHEIILSTTFVLSKREKSWRYSVTDQIARILVDEEMVDDISPQADKTQYAISHHGIRKHHELSMFAQLVKQKYSSWGDGLQCRGRGTCRAKTMDVDMSGTVFQYQTNAVVVCGNGNVSGAYHIDQFVIQS